MLPQYIWQNLHFVISLWAAMVFFAVFWLYLDAWTVKKHRKDIFKWGGALLLSISFLIESTVIEQSVLGKSLFGNGSESLTVIIRLAGYVCLIIGQLDDPLQPKPMTTGLNLETKKTAVVGTAPKLFGLIFGLPAAALAVSLLYLRRATVGLERHLRPMAAGFFLLFLSDLTHLGGQLRGTTNPSLYNLVKPFGGVWLAEHLFLLAAATVIGLWVWKYLIERFFSQVFMLIVGASVLIFLVSAVSFTFLLIGNIRNSALDNLQTASNVLNYAIKSKQTEARADASAAAKDPKVVAAVENKDHKALAAELSTYLQDNKLSGLTITNDQAQVLLRADDPDRWADSVSSDTAVRKSLIGQTTSDLVSSQGVLAPVVSIRSVVPIYDGDKVVGTVSTQIQADNAFVDGIKNSTGLDSSIFSGNTQSATTFTEADGHTRDIGVKLNDNKISDTVLKKGDDFKGEVTIQNRPYLAAYSPLKDVNNSVVGMIFIGKPQASLLSAAGRSTQLTFVISAVLIILSVVPAYIFAKHIDKQID